MVKDFEFVRNIKKEKELKNKEDFFLENINVEKVEFNFNFDQEIKLKENVNVFILKKKTWKK